jgi:hypothetical protein
MLTANSLEMDILKQGQSRSIVAGNWSGLDEIREKKLAGGEADEEENLAFARNGIAYASYGDGAERV